MHAMNEGCFAVLRKQIMMLFECLIEKKLDNTIAIIKTSSSSNVIFLMLTIVTLLLAIMSKIAGCR